MARPKVTILVDGREKNPLLFPPTLWLTDANGTRRLYTIAQESCNLPAGDYCIADYAASALVERKGSLDELRKNLLSEDRNRAALAFGKLVAATQYPYLLCDWTVPEFNKTDRNCLWPDVVQDRFFLEMAQRSIRILWLPSLKSPDPKSRNARQQQGALVVRVLWAHKLLHDKELQNAKQ